MVTKVAAAGHVQIQSYPRQIDAKPSCTERLHVFYVTISQLSQFLLERIRSCSGPIIYNIIYILLYILYMYNMSSTCQHPVHGSVISDTDEYV